MTAIVLIAAMIVAVNFAFYPFGLEAAALIFYAVFPAGQRLGVGEQPWMIGGFIAGVIVAVFCAVLLFEPHVAAVEVMAQWSLFTQAFGAEAFIQRRIGLSAIYINAFICFVAPVLLPLLVRQYARADLRRPPLAERRLTSSAGV
jgi:hypothetical protein